MSLVANQLMIHGGKLGAVGEGGEAIVHRQGFTLTAGHFSPGRSAATYLPAVEDFGCLVPVAVKWLRHKPQLGRECRKNSKACNTSTFMAVDSRMPTASRGREF